MPPKKNRNRSKNKKQNQNALADCVFPENIMLSILTRLPVKSLLRFKSVCTPWQELFATPSFIKQHRLQYSSNPANQNFMMYSLSKTNCVHTMSLFRGMDDEKNCTNIDHPYPEDLHLMDFVGSYNGLICVACPPLGRGIILWNPALRLWKAVRSSEVAFGDCESVSLGFGYNEEEDDYKVVRVVSLKGRDLKVAAEVYSAKSDSWKTIKVGLPFKVLSTKNDAIVGGDPYWHAETSKNASFGVQIVWFDVKKMTFKIVAQSSLRRGEEVPPLVDWKGSLAFIMNSGSRVTPGLFSSLHVCVFDKDGKSWVVKHSFDPLFVKIDKCLQCSRSGKIIAMNYAGKLFVYDPKEWRGVMTTQVKGAVMLSFQIYEYSESLVCLDGMESMIKVVKRKEDEVTFCYPDGVDPDLVRALMQLRLQHQHQHRAAAN